MVLVHFIYLFGHLFASLNAFLQKKQFDIVIQIFRNLQNFPQSRIAKIATFYLSANPLKLRRNAKIQI